MLQGFSLNVELITALNGVSDTSDTLCPCASTAGFQWDQRYQWHRRCGAALLSCVPVHSFMNSTRHLLTFLHAIASGSAIGYAYRNYKLVMQGQRELTS